MNDIIHGKLCTHYRLYRKIPIYSFTQGNNRDLPHKMCSTCYLVKNPQSRYNLVVVGNFFRNDSAQLHQLCKTLEDENIYYHKIDKDNLDSKNDIVFLKKMKAKSKLRETEEAKEEDEFSVYLFDYKLEPD